MFAFVPVILMNYGVIDGPFVVVTYQVLTSRYPQITRGSQYFKSISDICIHIQEKKRKEEQHNNKHQTKNKRTKQWNTTVMIPPLSSWLIISAPLKYSMSTYSYF